MAHGNLRRNGDTMGSIEFKNQDGEWEKFPTDEELYALKEMVYAQPNPPVNPELMTICHLCNEPFPMEQIMITGGSLRTGFTWSCPKCHAVSSIGKA